jgi:hypothetical protein
MLGECCFAQSPSVAATANVFPNIERIWCTPVEDADELPGMQTNDMVYWKEKQMALMARPGPARSSGH